MLEYGLKYTYDYDTSAFGNRRIERIEKFGLLMPPDVANYDSRYRGQWPSIWVEYFRRLDTTTQYPLAVLIYRTQINSPLDDNFFCVRFFTRFGDSLFLHTYASHYVFETEEVLGLRSALNFLNFSMVASTDTSWLYFGEELRGL